MWANAIWSLPATALTFLLTALPLSPEFSLLAKTLYIFSGVFAILSIAVLAWPFFRRLRENKFVPVGSLVPSLATLKVDASFSKQKFDAQMYIDIQNTTRFLIYYRARVYASVNGIEALPADFRGIIYASNKTRIIGGGIGGIPVLENGDIPPVIGILDYEIEYGITDKKKFKRYTARRAINEIRYSSRRGEVGSVQVQNITTRYEREIER